MARFFVVFPFHFRFLFFLPPPLFASTLPLLFPFWFPAPVPDDDDDDDDDSLGFWIPVRAKNSSSWSIDANTSRNLPGVADPKASMSPQPEDGTGRTLVLKRFWGMADSRAPRNLATAFSGPMHSAMPGRPRQATPRSLYFPPFSNRLSGLWLRRWCECKRATTSSPPLAVFDDCPLLAHNGVVVAFVRCLPVAFGKI